MAKAARITILSAMMFSPPARTVECDVRNALLYYVKIGDELIAGSVSGDAIQ